ncbi:MAG: acetyl/propionyl/methylcrotonyl-CoA carboxylase subunit alpha [Alphaproteobacteria bacterium]|nr:acetyl/propionyl/methylcrotonyl-CoA carboxylase subunit alpha [Alphaproteobacteria bacterium]
MALFRKILVANRGEIACRVMRTARRLGIATVAVYSDADAGAPHVRMADAAHRIGPPAPSESYLQAARVIEAARSSGAEAVHPGYGFLSENAAFAEACAEAGLVFIGPPPAAIRAMGLKGAAKALMEKAGVPVVPGYHGDDQSPELLAAEAARIGYPVLIKAVAGGGGKGMRRVDRPAEFAAALDGARREARGAFGDDKVLIEKYLVKPRHIEIQVFADMQGNAVHLFERDCSLQRRHQKVIEEAPAPGMPPAMREAMGRAAVAAARAIGYVGAGTVEFIADVAEGLRPDAFYFMEMNTRLQVEHPVTEMITGQDLVEWQIRVAAGQRLPLDQEALAIDGHAFEARVYAEDPARGFLPSIGRLLRLRPPAEGPHVRVDSGVVEGDSVTPHYDPMIAKLIVWDRDRASALRHLASALERFEVAGLTSNVDFLGAVARHPAFAAGDVDTGFIERHRGELLPEAAAPGQRALAVAAAGVLLERAQQARAQAARSGDPHSPWSEADGWRLNDLGRADLRFLSAEGEHGVSVHYLTRGWRFEIGGARLEVQAEMDGDGRLAVEIDGVRLSATLVRHGGELTLLMPGETARLSLFDPLAVTDDDEGAGDLVAAPMPGRIIQVLAAPGLDVAKGQPLLILEAMKMEHTIAAPRAGTIEKIAYAAGDQVAEGATLLTFRREE